MEEEEVKGFVKAAYFAGFEEGNQYDNGCSPEDFATFDEWYDKYLKGIQ